MAEVLAQLTSPASDCGTKTDASGNEFITRPIPEGLRTWLPALVVLLGMPVLALFATKFALMPPMKRAVEKSAALNASYLATHGTGPVFYAKLPLDRQSGFRSLALVSSDNSILGKIDQNKSKLLALATTEFKDTTVSDLDIPGALDAKRAQLLKDFNHALGGPIIQDVYIAEYPQRP